ncbi:MAG: signal peptidase I [Pseudomonadota bacterium]
MKNWARANKGFLLFLMLFGVFRTAIADWNPIPSGSMRPNILEGDVVLVNRVAFDLKVPLTSVVIAHLGEPRRGDVVVFYSPQGGTRLIKRVIALPGDIVAMRDGRLSINGQASAYVPLGQAPEPVAPGVETAALQFDETIAGGHHSIQLMPEYAARRDFGPVTIPQDEFMMLGDNRDNSADSRIIGLVPRALLIGRAERVLVSADILGNWMPRGERFGKSLGQP